jgi:tetratricopeptide (TPR) repeat protein
MKLIAQIAVLVGVAFLTLGCGSKKPVEVKSAAVESAERLERRATTAYTKGDHVGAVKDFQAAASVYESLAMSDALANTQLSLARIDSDDGRPAEALTRVSRVLSLPSAGAVISPSTLLVAHGRAAALYMQQKDLAAAGRALNASEALCTVACEASSALSTLRTHWHLSANNLTAARASASASLAQATTPSDKANALRGLAQVGLAEGQYAEAIQNAEQALALDQALGASNRVIADLDLLSDIYAKAGDAAKASNFTELSRAAAAARARLSSRSGGK